LIPLQGTKEDLRIKTFSLRAMRKRTIKKTPQCVLLPQNGGFFYFAHLLYAARAEACERARALFSLALRLSRSDSEDFTFSA